MLRIIKNNSAQQLVINKNSFLLINEWDETIVNNAFNFDALLIVTQNTESFNTIVSTIRTHHDASIYLKPLFYQYEVKSSFIIHTEGLLNETTSSKIIQEIEQKVQEIKPIHTLSYNETIQHRFLHYLYSRQGKIIPKKNRNETLGYLFPFISLFNKEQNFSIFSILDKAEKQQLIEGKTTDYVQLCNPCQDSYLVYKETCPKCSSIHITPQDIIHHFVCAHVAPEDDFKKEGTDEMECPKCNKHLRHIGIDYDKPSAVYHCNTCKHDFQNAEVIAECHTCDHQNHLEELIQVPIKQYSLTLKGIQLIKNGADTSLNNKPQNNLSSIFYQLIKHEAKRTNSNSFIGTIIMDTQLLQRLNEDYKNKLEKELNQIINQYIEDPIHHIKEKNKHHVLLLDQTEKNAKEMIQKLEQNLAILLQDNLFTDLNIRSEICTTHQFTQP